MKETKCERVDLGGLNEVLEVNECFGWRAVNSLTIGNLYSITFEREIADEKLARTIRSLEQEYYELKATAREILCKELTSPGAKVDLKAQYRDIEQMAKFRKVDARRLLS